MWSALAFLLLVQQVFAGIFIPIHGYGKNVQKRRSPPYTVERMCWLMAHEVATSVAPGQSRELTYPNLPSVCYDYFQQEQNIMS